ncbi:dephospho-CoA kinase [Desulfocastanea catecholica]
MNIAVTGSLGTGKSTVSKILAATLETELVDTDQLCHRQMLPGTEGFEEFRRTFGKKFLQSDNTIDRLALRQAVFEDEEIRMQLERILHPLVQREVSTICRECKRRGKILVVEVPLLYEVGWQDQFDASVVVYVPEKICIERVRARNGMAVEEIKQILRSQMSIDKKRDWADFIIDNSGTFVSTVQQIAWLSKKLSRKLKV